MDRTKRAQIEWEHDKKRIKLSGCWTTSYLHKNGHLDEWAAQNDSPTVTIDASEISQFDSAGAIALANLVNRLTRRGIQPQLEGLSDAQSKLYRFVEAKYHELKEPSPKPSTSWTYRIGESLVTNFRYSCNFMAFIGEVAEAMGRSLGKPSKWNWPSIAGEIQNSGSNALILIGFMALLIGIVITYQLSTQLVQYGANIFIVDFTGIAILREFAPLITAVLVAARTSTAFAALVGTMKIDEEIDVLKTMGLSPINRLVIPRILALLVVVPLLTVWADIWGVTGGMLMANNLLDVNFTLFLQRFHEKISIHHYMFGLIKTPVFALIIASAGCYQGFRTGNDAASLGRHTTRGVVQAIFLIICTDAAFSVIFSELGI